jgi:hypothetical protein
MFGIRRGLILTVLTGTAIAGDTTDADALAYQPRLSVSTLTSYGWTAQFAMTGYISC